MYFTNQIELEQQNIHTPVPASNHSAHPLNKVTERSEWQRETNATTQIDYYDEPINHYELNVRKIKYIPKRLNKEMGVEISDYLLTE